MISTLSLDHSGGGMRGWERMDRWDLEGWKLWTLGPLFGDMDFMFQVMLYGTNGKSPCLGTIFTFCQPPNKQI